MLHPCFWLSSLCAYPEGLGLGGTSGPAYKPLVSKPDTGELVVLRISHSRSTLVLAQIMMIWMMMTPGSSSPGSVSAAPDNHATDGTSSVPWPSRSTPDNESDANLLLCVALHASKSLQLSFGSFLRIGLLLLRFLKLMMKYLSLMMMPCI